MEVSQKFISQKIQGNQNDNSPLPCQSINIQSIWSSRAELAHVREDRHGVIKPRQSQVPSLLPGVGVRVVGEDGGETWHWIITASCEDSYSIEWKTTLKWRIIKSKLFSLHPITVTIEITSAGYFVLHRKRTGSQTLPESCSGPRSWEPCLLHSSQSLPLWWRCRRSPRHRAFVPPEPWCSS